MKRIKRKKLKSYPQSDAQAEYNYNSAGNSTSDGPWMQRNGMVFGFGGGLVPEQHSSIGLNPYGNTMRRQGGRIRKYEFGGHEGAHAEQDFGGNGQGNVPPTVSTPNYAGYAGTALNAYNSFTKASNNPNNTSGQNTAAGINSGIDAVAGSYFPWYALAKTASGIGKSTLKTNDQGQLASSTERQANNAMTPVHETSINHFGAGDWKAGIGSIATGGISDNIAEVYGLNPNSMRKKNTPSIQFDPQAVQNSINANYNDSYLAGTKGIVNNQVARNGGRIRAQYPQGGQMRRIPGGIMMPMGNGVETAIGNQHSQGGMQYSPNSEIQGGEQVLDGQYVLTNEPGSEPMMETSISKRFNKNLNSISSRNSRDDIDTGTEKLKQDAIIKNEQYLMGTNPRRKFAPGGYMDMIDNPYTRARMGVQNGNQWFGATADVADVEIPHSREGIPNSPVMAPQGQFSGYGTTGGNEPFGMYNWGSRVPTNNPYNQAETNNLPVNYEMDPEQTRAGKNYFGPNPLIEVPTQQYGTQVNGMTPASRYSPGSQQVSTRKRTGTGNTEDSYLKYLQYAKPLADLYGALDKPARLRPDNYKIPLTNPKHVTDEDSLREINTGYYTGLYNLKNSGNYSRGSQVSLAAQRMKASAASRERLQNENAQIDNRAEALNAEINSRNMGTKLNVDQFNIASKSKKNEYLNQLGVDLSNIGSESYIRDKYPEYFKQKKRKGGRLYKMRGY